MESEVVAVDGGLLGVWKYGLHPGHCAEGCVDLEAKEKEVKCVEKNFDGCDAVVERSLETTKSPEEKPMESDAMSEALLKAAKSPAKSPAKKPEDSNAVSEGLLNRSKTKQWKKLHGLEMALLSLTEAVLKLCASIVWLYLNVLLIYLGVSLLLGGK